MGSCATGTCEPDCAFCADLRRRFPPVRKCGRATDAGDACELIARHPAYVPCRGRRGKKAERLEKATRDGEPATKRRDPTFTPRRRVGPHR